MTTALSTKDFILKVLSAAGLAIVIALIPNAVLGTILKPLASEFKAVADFLFVAGLMQSTASLLVGVCVGLFLELGTMSALLIGIASFVASGVVSPVEVTTAAGQVTKVLQVRGLGDLVNAIFVAGLTAKFLQKFQNKFGSLSIIALPILGAALFGYLGLVILPYVKLVTQAVADLISLSSNASPLVVSTIVGAAFAVIIVSPISSVVVAYAISATGLVSGAANLGCSATFVILFCGSIFVNKRGVSIAIAIGAVKMMVGNLFKYPILALPLAISGAVGGITAYAFGIEGTPASAGFGFSGLVGPSAAYAAYEAKEVAQPILKIVIAFLVVPTISAIVINFLFIKVLKIYTLEIFHFDPEQAMATNKK